MGFELGTFRFILQQLNQSGHSPQFKLHYHIYYIPQIKTSLKLLKGKSLPNSDQKICKFDGFKILARQILKNAKISNFWIDLLFSIDNTWKKVVPTYFWDIDHFYPNGPLPLDPIRLSPSSCETQRMLIEVVKRSNWHLHTTHREKDDIGKVSSCGNKWYTLF